jgi:hypothetical protein
MIQSLSSARRRSLYRMILTVLIPLPPLDGRTRPSAGATGWAHSGPSEARPSNW